jgi:ADP-heptose:LPS heptosyltransferase
VRQEAGVECADVTGSLSLGASLGLLSRATLFVGNDSGPRHLAMAAGVPTVGIFWARHALTFGPAVVGAHRVLLSHRDDCRACGRRQSLERCGHEESFVDDVHVSDVLAASLDALSWADRARTRPGGGARRPLLV